MNYSTYDALPAYEPATWTASGLPIRREGVILWAGKDAPPTIGTKIRVTMNKLGVAEVRGYFSEDGFLGLLVRFTDPPAWWLRQSSPERLGHIFGPEFEVVAWPS